MYCHRRGWKQACARGRRLSFLAVLSGVAGCVASPSLAPLANQPPAPSYVPSTLAPIALPEAPARPSFKARITKGTGQLVGEPPFAEHGTALEGEPVTLDFANADVRDVVRSVLGDILHLPYVVDPNAQGTITLRSGGPIPRGRVLPELGSALRLAGLAVVQSGGLYKVVPLAQASREVQLAQGAQTGYVAEILTPRYVAATELDRLLEPLAPPGVTLRAEPSRNILIVNGPAQDVHALLANLAIFDVDVLRGLSTALLPLHAADAEVVAKEVEKLLTSLGDAGQLVRVVPLDRLNALLVTAMRPDYIDRIRRWVENLDRSGGSAQRQLFVYDVQNGRAADLADVLRKALGLAGQGSDSSTAQGSATTTSPPHENASETSSTTAPSASANPLLGGLSGAGAGSGSASEGTASGPQTEPTPSAGPEKDGIRITADQVHNALLIDATQPEFATISAALRRLDVPPLQVMLEATVAEVTLTNQLSYGLQYYIKSGNLQALFAVPASGSTTTANTGFSFASGFNLAYGTAAGSTAILQLLQQLTHVRVLSSPNLLVSNNQQARIQVGDQVPIATGSAVSTIGSNAPIVNSIEYRDTGVILRVTPRVNASGVVSLDVGEEVSSVSTTTTSNIDSPTISERRLDTTVTVSDGQTVALGGLISDSRTNSRNGIPILQDIPGLGWLFGQRSNQLTHTELIAILTPHVVRSPLGLEAITEELQRKLPLTIPVRAGAP